VAGERRHGVGGRGWARPARSRAPALVGSGHELALLEAELAGTAAGELRCVLLSGDPGVGKTRLATEFLSRHSADATGLFARGYPLATTTAFGLWADGLEPLLRGLSREEIHGLCGGFVDDLASLLHGVAAVAEPGAGREPPRLRVLEGLARMLENLSGKGPMVAVLDDAHLADARVLEGTPTRPHRPSATDGSTPGTWAGSTRTATSGGTAAATSSSSAAARTSPRWRWRTS
jgi:AAA ATPase-like protein